MKVLTRLDATTFGNKLFCYLKEEQKNETNNIISVIIGGPEISKENLKEGEGFYSQLYLNNIYDNVEVDCIVIYLYEITKFSKRDIIKLYYVNDNNLKLYESAGKLAAYLLNKVCEIEFLSFDY